MCVLKRRNSALAGTVALAASAVFLMLPVSQAGAVTSTNVCNWRAPFVLNVFAQVDVEMTAAASPDPVSPGGSVSLSSIDQTVPQSPEFFLEMYRVGLLETGPTTLAADARSIIEGTNTIEGAQTTNNASVLVTGTITDPTPEDRSSGDESATVDPLNVTYADQTWTAGSSGIVEFREDTTNVFVDLTAISVDIFFPIPGGFARVQLHCSPGTFTAGMISYIDPAPSFVSTNIQVPPVIDATGDVIANGPVSSTKTSKSFVYKVSNVGLVPITLDFAADIAGSVNVNGTETGTVSVNAGTKTLNPGASTRVKLVWSYAAGELATGDSVVFNACVNAAGDIVTSNDCGSASATAK